MRRWKLLVALAGLAVVVTAGVVVLWPRTHRLALENFDQLREGMTLSDVEALLGPWGDYRSGPTVVTGPFDPCMGHNRYPPGMMPTAASGGYWRYTWETDVASVQAILWPVGDELEGSDPATAKLISASFTNMVLEKGPLDNLLWRAQRQWHRWFPE
jgi:hypothetical protein